MESLTPENDRFKELQARLISGDLSVVDEIVRGHVRLAIKIAGQYARIKTQIADDLVSEAMFALVTGCKEIASGRMKSDNMLSYLATRIHTCCLELLRKDKLFGATRRAKKYREEKGLPPITEFTRHEISMKVPVVSPKNSQFTANHPAMLAKNEQGKVEIEEILEMAAPDKIARRIVQLRMEGYKLREIADELEMSTASVARNLDQTLGKIKRLIEDADADVPPISKICGLRTSSG